MSTQHHPVQAANLPKPAGPYSPGMRLGNLVFVSGQGATDPATGKLVGADVEAQTEQVLRNVQAILKAAGSDLQHVLRCGVFLHRHEGVPEDERRLLADVRRPSAGEDDDSGRGTARRGIARRDRLHRLRPLMRDCDAPKHRHTASDLAHIDGLSRRIAFAFTRFGPRSVP